jgi:hypothetical protein
MALIACGVVALGIALNLPRGASREAVPAIQPAE